MKRSIPMYLVGGLLLLLSASFALAADEPAAAPESASETRSEAQAALEGAQADLAEVDQRMEKLKVALEIAYRELDDANRRHHADDATTCRASLDKLKGTRLELDEERNRSLLRVDLHEAHLEVAQANDRIADLEAEGSDTKSETKKLDRAQKRVLKLTKTLEEIP